MGVYVFRSVHAPYVKVGHHLVTTRRPNAYYRIAGRGFESIIHPDELHGRTYIPDLVLVGWYPQLTRTVEAEVHRHFSVGRVGEFHRLEDLDEILAWLGARDIHCDVSDAARARAVQWGQRQIRRARRRARRRVVAAK